MDYNKQHIEVIRENYEILIQLGIPIAILENLNRWMFFLQEGWDQEINWQYAKEMPELQQIQLYRFIRLHNLQSCLSNEIEKRYHLKNKQQLGIKIVDKTPSKIFFDFFINTTPLSKQIGINRFDMAYSDFDLDTFEVDQNKFPSYDRKKIIKSAVSRFLGNSKPMNQLGTNRVVLYRCHCGSDYCGIISFTLHIQDDEVIWKNITYEDDSDAEFSDELNQKELNSISEISFNKREYEFEFENYLKKYCV